MRSLALTLASSTGSRVFDDAIQGLLTSPLLPPSLSSAPLTRPQWTSKCVSVHIPSFDAVSSLRASISNKMSRPAICFKSNAVSSAFFVAESSGVCVRIQIEPPHIRTLIPAIHCSRVIAIDFDPLSACLYMLIVKETPRGGGFATHKPSPPSKSAAPNLPSNREGIVPTVTVHPGDVVFKAKQRHTRPDVGDCAEDFAGFATLDTTLQLLRCSASGSGDLEVMMESAAAGNMVHSLVASREQSSGSGVSVLFGAKQLTPEFAQELKRLGITSFASTIPLARDDTGCIVAAASPLLISLHSKDGSMSGHWSKTTAALTHNAQCCSLSPDGRVLAALLSNNSVVLYMKSAAASGWVLRGKCTPRPSAGLRSMAVTMVAPASLANGGSSDDAIVAVSSTLGIIQVWYFSSSPTAVTASAASSMSSSASRSLTKRGSMTQFDDNPVLGIPTLSPFLCGLHSIGACDAHDDLRVALLRVSAGSGDELDGLCVVAADAIGTVRMFDVRTNPMGCSEGAAGGVVMISSRGDRKQEQVMPAVGNAAAVVAFEIVPPCNLVTLDATGMIMMHSARISALIAKSDGLDITRVDCFVIRAAVAIGSELPTTHAMNLSQHESYMFTGSSDGSLRSYDRDFICYWQTRVCDCGISCMKFSSDSVLHIGSFNGRIMAFSLSRCAVVWSTMIHSGRVQVIDATSQHTASIADDGIVIVTNSDGVAVYTLRCDVGWCGVRFTQTQNLVTVSNSGRLQVRTMASLPPKSADCDVAWNCKVEVEVETCGGRCTAFDVLEDALGGGSVAVMAIGQVGGDEHAANDVAAVVVDLTYKIVAVKYRGPSAPITSIAFATGNWSLLPPLKGQERGGTKKTAKKDTFSAESANHPALTDASGSAVSSAANKVAAGGVSCLSGVNAIVASCRDGTGW